MKLTAFCLLVFALHLHAHVRSQTITFSGSNVPMENVLQTIEQQTGYLVIYEESVLAGMAPVTVHASHLPLDNFLRTIFQGRALTYSIQGKNISLRKTSPVPFADKPTPPALVTGLVIDESGIPMNNVSVVVTRTGKGISTDVKGNFTLGDLQQGDVIVFSFVGYERMSVTFSGQQDLRISLKPATSTLDQVVVQAYGTTTERLGTGNIGKISGKQIVAQPVSDPLLAMQGRVPGLLVTQNNGVAGSSVSVQIRGRNSLAQGSDPLYVIDGVPFAPNNSITTQYQSALIGSVGLSAPAGASPFNSINPADIESIEILKDADATSIYGSRGANGVILITTKKGKAGRTSFSANVYSGASQITHFVPMMNNVDYQKMRREAFANDGVNPSPRTGPDLLFYDSTRYTDMKELLIGGTAHVTDAQAAIAGGNANTTFRIGAGYHRQTSVFPGDLADKRASVHMNFNQTSNDRRFSANLSTIYSSDKNNLITTDLTYLITTPATIPPLYDSVGNLNWRQNGSVFANPLSFSKKPYSVVTDNLLSNLTLSYHLLPGLTVRSSFGYNTFQVAETQLDPIASLFPNGSQTGSSAFATNNFKSWIIEPQAEYQHQFGKGKLTVLTGGTFQEQTNYNTLTSGTGYTSDNLLKSLSAAAEVNASNASSEYHYQAVFGRANFNWDDKYLVTGTIRRDGSSRFGPGKQFGTFGSIAGAWVFSNLRGLRGFSALSFGKLRSSYGTSGNDQIGNYQFLDSWTAIPLGYAESSALTPSRLFNADYGWEVNKKLEIALDLGFFHDRLLFSAAAFRNRSSNQLIGYALPAQTGATTVIRNFPATVENKGLELILSGKIISTTDVTWTSSVNVTLPKNKLVEFTGLETSSYRNSYIVGQSLSSLKRYHSLGVDPQTGIYSFDSKSGSTSAPSDSDLVYIGNLDPKVYAGWQNSVSFKGFQLDVLLEFRQQMGLNMKDIIAKYVPGMRYNQPEAFLRRWQKPGDQTNIAQFTANFSNPAAIAAAGYYGNSDAVFSDITYARLKNISLSYTLPTRWISKARLQNARIYVLGQNLLTITNYDGNDPETQRFYSLPPLKTITAGVQFTF